MKSSSKVTQSWGTYCVITGQACMKKAQKCFEEPVPNFACPQGRPDLFAFLTIFE